MSIRIEFKELLLLCGAEPFAFHFATKNIIITELQFCLLFCMCMKLGLLHWGRNTVWGC